MKTAVELKEFKGTKEKWNSTHRRDRVLIQTENKAICDVWGKGVAENTNEEMAANAKLIAAAPELLQALQNLINANKGNGKSVMREIENAEKAIDKAL